MKKAVAQSETARYNHAVHQAYGRILTRTKQLLASLEQEELRYVLERMERTTIPQKIIHELVNPLVYLRLDTGVDGVMGIHFGIEPAVKSSVVSSLTSTFFRMVYDYTARDVTKINIEDCVKTDWLINVCSEMYEYIEERNKYHVFKIIKHKPNQTRQKRLLVAV